MSEDNDKIRDQKTVSYFSALVNGWLATRLERDKSLLALSAGGIGLLVALLTTVGASIYGLVLFIFGILSFLICLSCVLTIFSRNADLLEQQITKQKGVPELGLKALDKTAKYSFILGTAFSFMIGILAGVDSLRGKGGQTMTDEKSEKAMIDKAKKVIHDPFDKVKKESWDGIDRLNPAPPDSGGGEGDGDSGGDKDKE